MKTRNDLLCIIALQLPWQKSWWVVIPDSEYCWYDGRHKKEHRRRYRTKQWRTESQNTHVMNYDCSANWQTSQMCQKSFSAFIISPKKVFLLFYFHQVLLYFVLGTQHETVSFLPL